MQSKTFYLIDDDEDEQYVFELALADIDKAARLIWRPDAQLAINELNGLSQKPDYIFIDVNMPRLGGWQCLELIRNIPYFSETPIAIYSTSASQSMRGNESRAALVSACINKKPSIPELATTLREFILQFP